MPEFDHDLFVIGAGSGGVRAARISASLGAKVAIAEDRYLGGTCVNVGCVPKKLFVYASHFAEDFKIARSFGWSIDNTNFNWRGLIENKDTEIERLNRVYQKILDDAGVETITGRATLIDANTISVNDNSYTAERILIATGGWPSVPDQTGIEYAITSNEVFHLESLPDRMIIVGGGYIAVEFACILHGLGVETTLLYRGPLFLRGFDQDLRAILADEMRNKGIKLLFNTNVTGITKTDSVLKIQLTTDQQLMTNTIMYATGRTPNTANIGLEKVGVKLDSKGAIVVNDGYQSSVPSIYAIGDVIDRVKLTPVALAEGMVLARSLFSKQSIKVNYADIPTCVFSQPNLGTVGLTEEEARERYDEIAVYKSRFKPMKLSLSDSSEKTFMKLIVDKASDRVVGVHMVGPDAGEIIQGVAIAMKAGATKATFDATIGIHPTAAEEFVTMREPV
jgi:glutathione reductase (NADPH)